MKFGRLTFTADAGRRPFPSGSKSLWLLRCDCGTEITRLATQVKRGYIRSCGCLKRDLLRAKKTSHGDTDSVEYGTWSRMIQRCHNPKNKSFERYGAKGIAVCKEWRENYAAFLAHVGRRPAGKTSLDRIDAQRGYEPGNVRWADIYEQNRNRQMNKYVEHEGELLCLKEYCQRVGISYNTVQYRRNQQGWTLERAISPRDARGRSTDQ